VTESAIQKSIVQGLRLLLPHGWLIQSTANKPRSKVAGAIEKGMGAIAGWPDIAVYGRFSLYADDERRPAVWFLEIKTPNGRLSPAQRAVHDQLLDLGFGVGVARSLDEAVAFGRAQFWPLKSSRLAIAADKGRLGE
jgi:hypothetical protein